ncbi:MAG: hypothetical protein JWR63_325, partial [Conexibacter sp.]|nr:hypothetical protein [Conexibacter sp.]
DINADEGVRWLYSFLSADRLRTYCLNEAPSPDAINAAAHAPASAPPPAPAVLPDGLSAREAELLALVARGLSNREIGAVLLISEHTVANHMRSILRKTGCANRTQAASYAHRQGLAES